MLLLVVLLVTTIAVALAVLTYRACPIPAVGLLLLATFAFHLYGLVAITALDTLQIEPVAWSWLSSYPFYLDTRSPELVDTVALSGGFSIVYFGLMYAVIKLGARFTKPAEARVPRDRSHSFAISAWGLLAVAVVAAVVTRVAWQDTINLAETVDAQRTAYIAYKRGADIYGAAYPALRTLLDMGMTAASVYWAGVLTNGSLGYNIQVARPDIGPLRVSQMVGFVIVTAALVDFAYSVGDRSSLVFGLLVAVALIRRFRLGIRTMAMVAVVLIGVNAIGYFRADWEEAQFSSADIAESAATGLFLHNETLNPLSMYAVMRADTPPTGGASFIAATENLLPRFLTGGTVETFGTTYTTFAETIGALDDTGWSFGYATDWYMNFGVLGVIAGAALLGAIHGYLAYRAVESDIWWIILASQVAAFPVAIRGGIGFKAPLYAAIACLLLISLCRAVWLIGSTRSLAALESRSST